MRTGIPLAVAAATVLLVAAHGGQPYDGSWTTEEGCGESRPCELVTKAKHHGGLVDTAGDFESTEDEHVWDGVATVFDDRPTQGKRQVVRVTATFEVTELKFSPPEEADEGLAAVNLWLFASDAKGSVRSEVSKQLAEFHVVKESGLVQLISPSTRVESSKAKPGIYTLETTLARDDGEPLGSKILARADVQATGSVDAPGAFSYDVDAQVTSISVEPA